MKPLAIAFVSYPINDVKRARNFYENILKLVPTNVWESPESSFIEYDLGPDTIAIGKGAPNFTSGKSGGTAAIEVEDFDAAIKHFQENKVKFLMDPMDTGGCHMVLIEDTEGNQIMIHKKKAK